MDRGDLEPGHGLHQGQPGCKHCYAERMAQRLQAMGQPNYGNGFELTLQPHMLELPLRWKKPQTIFVNSMSDLFHEDVPLEFIQRVFDVMRRAHWHRFQVLTKRAERLARARARARLAGQRLDGRQRRERATTSTGSTTCGAPARASSSSRSSRCSARCPTSTSPASTGSSSAASPGPGARPMEAAWVTRHPRPVPARPAWPFFFKQWGGVNKKQTGRVLEGRTWDEMPDWARSAQRGGT